MQDEPLENGISVRVIACRRPSEAQRRSEGVRAMRAMEKARGAPITRFKRIMEFARDLADLDREALPLLIAALGRTVQSQAIIEPILRYPKDTSSSAFSPDMLFFSEFAKLDAQGRTFREIAVEIQQMRELRLDRDVVIPSPWEPRRLQTALSKLRPGGTWGPWREDYNHQIEFWEPIGIGWVHGGNHSISAGILTASGTVKPTFGYDITPVYEHVVCNGRAFRRKHDGAIIAEVSSVEMAAIFEVGRLMVGRT
jgi:hypothetical protein